MRELGSEIAGGDKWLAEGRVVVVGDYFAVGGNVLRHVSVGVVGGEIQCRMQNW